MGPILRRMAYARYLPAFRHDEVKRTLPFDSVPRTFRRALFSFNNKGRMNEAE
jgi:hypothetical protein